MLDGAITLLVASTPSFVACAQ